MQRIVPVVTVIFSAASLAAQEPQCTTFDDSATAACNTAVDAIRAFHPLAGVIVSGGSPALGSWGSLGGAGHVSVTVRVNGVTASLPDPDSASESSVPSSFDGYVPAPVVEAALGLVRGRNGFLAVDALGSALLLPTGVEDLSVDPGAAHIGGAALGLGYGVRIGLLTGSLAVPTVSVSWMHRTLPRLQYGTLGPTFGTGDLFEFHMDLRADNYRAVASWKLPLVDLAVGIGVDHYTSSETNIRFRDTPTSVRTVVINPRNTRQLLFVDGGLNLGAGKLVAELGFQTGKDQDFTTTFRDFDPKAGHVFGGIGFRFGF